jgi:hypothetical protein
MALFWRTLNVVSCFDYGHVQFLNLRKYREKNLKIENKRDGYLIWFYFKIK